MEDVPSSSHGFQDPGQHDVLQNPKVDVCVEFFVCSKECGGIRSPSLVTTPSTMIGVHPYLILAILTTLLCPHTLRYAEHSAPWDPQELSDFRQGPPCAQRLEHGGWTVVFSDATRHGLT